MRYLNNLDDFPPNARICLYGAGDYGLALFNLLKIKRPDVHIVCFVDTFNQAPVCGLRTRHPDQLSEIGYDFIVITSHAFIRSISEALEEKNINNYCALNPIFPTSNINIPAIKKDSLSNVLYAFYDLSVSPYGFDIVFFLFLAEIERIKKKCDYLHPVIVPQASGTLLSKETAYTDGMGPRLRYGKRDGWWFRNIIVPCSWLMESCKQISVCTSRNEAALIFESFATHIYPDNYQVSHPVEGYSDTKVVSAMRETPRLPSFKSTKMSQEYVKSWVDTNTKNRKVVTITLRESPYKMDDIKNSNLNEWIKFAKSLDKEQYCPVFIRDTSVALGALPEELKDFLVFSEIPWNIELRMALYEQSYINMFVGNGPGILCLLNRTTRCLIFMLPYSGSVSEENQFKIAGVPAGSAYPNLTKFQKIIFSEAPHEILAEEFRNLCLLIEEKS